jgi:hypothetical protein
LKTPLAAVMAAQLDALRRAEPEMPDGLSDRCEDVLEPLLLIAEAAGGDWPEAARAAAVVLMGEAARTAREADQNLPLELLTDLRPLLAADTSDSDLIATSTLLEGLRALEDRPWPTFVKNEKPITHHGLSRLLKGFDIKPIKVRLGGGKPVGCYRRTAFEDAFARYLGIDTEQRNNANKTGPETAKTATEHDESVPYAKSAIDPDKHWVGSVVPYEKPDHEEEDV